MWGNVDPKEVKEVGAGGNKNKANPGRSNQPPHTMGILGMRL